jgi:hypothetical protein
MSYLATPCTINLIRYIKAGDCNAKIEREAAFEPFMWNWRLHELSKENEIRAIAFGIERGWRQGDALFATLFNIVLEKVIRNIETNPSGAIFERMKQYIERAEGVFTLGLLVREFEAVVEAS